MREAGSPIRVLHVDDDRQYAETTAAFLRQSGHEFDVEIATDVSAGLARLGAATFDCVISDYEMPGRNGIDFLRTVRERDPDLPFILHTGRGSEAVAGEAISAGVTDYMQKGSDTSHYELLTNRVVNAVEQYRSQVALSASRERFALFIDRSPLGFVEYDQDFEIRRVNDTLTEIFGYDEQELLGETWEVFVSSDSYDDVEEVTTALSEARGGYHSIDENVRKDGERIVVEWHNRLITDDSGDVVTVFSHCQDVTERIERERNLAQIRDFFAEAEELGDLGAWEYDETGRVTWTAGTRRMHDVDDDFEPTVESGIDFYHPEDRETIRTAVERALETGDPYDVEARLITATDERKWVRTRGKRVDDTDPRTVRGFIQDITEQKERERTLKLQNERLDSFASVLSHDLQNPLSVAQSRLELARQEGDSDHFNAIERAHRRMQTLIDDILTLARNGNAAMTLEPVALGPLAAGCWESVDTGTATLVTDTEQAVLADATRLRRLLENLFQNAVEHASADHPQPGESTQTGAEGATANRTESSAGGVTVTIGDLATGSGFYVADDGPGIPPAERDEVFQPGHSTAAAGTGFGLAIVAEIAAAHGWEVGVTESETGGARFEVTGVERAGES